MSDVELVELNIIEPDTPVLRQALDYWYKLRKNRKFPSRKDLDPADIKDLIPCIVLVDVIDGGLDFRYRLHAAGVSSISQFSYHGKLVSEIDIQCPPSSVHSAYFKTLELRAPLGVRVPYVGHESGISHTDTLTMPLSDDDQNINCLFTVVDLSAIRPSGL